MPDQGVLSPAGAQSKASHTRVHTRAGLRVYSKQKQVGEFLFNLSMDSEGPVSSERYARHVGPGETWG